MKVLLLLLSLAGLFAGGIVFTHQKSTPVSTIPVASSTPVIIQPDATGTPIRKSAAVKQPAPPSKTTPVAVKPSTTTPVTTTPIAPTIPATSTPQTLTSVQRIELAIHAGINAERVKAGLTQLALSSTLGGIARAHSVDMQANNYFEHDDLQGCSVSCRLDKTGYRWSMVGENIYMMSGYTLSEQETAQKIVDGWMNSPGHKANILTANFTEEGIGVAVVGNSIYATEDFARPR
jgi:uncharacterized protein YkwD